MRFRLRPTPECAVIKTECFCHLKMECMKKYQCIVCGYVYDPAVGDPDHGIDPGTAFEELPEDWTCPLCGVGKEEFEEVAE